MKKPLCRTFCPFFSILITFIYANAFLMINAIESDKNKTRLHSYNAFDYVKNGVLKVLANDETKCK